MIRFGMILVAALAALFFCAFPAWTSSIEVKLEPGNRLDPQGGTMFFTRSLGRHPIWSPPEPHILSRDERWWYEVPSHPPGTVRPRWWTLTLELPGVGVLLVIGLLAHWAVESERAARRVRRGLCEKCGYNLTAAPSPLCPECGTAHATAPPPTTTNNGEGPGMFGE